MPGADVAGVASCGCDATVRLVRTVATTVALRRRGGCRARRAAAPSPASGGAGRSPQELDRLRSGDRRGGVGRGGRAARRPRGRRRITAELEAVVVELDERRAEVAGELGAAEAERVAAEADAATVTADLARRGPGAAGTSRRRAGPAETPSSSCATGPSAAYMDPVLAGRLDVLSRPWPAGARRRRSVPRGRRSTQQPVVDRTRALEEDTEDLARASSPRPEDGGRRRRDVVAEPRAAELEALRGRAGSGPATSQGRGGANSRSLLAQAQAAQGRLRGGRSPSLEAGVGRHRRPAAGPPAAQRVRRAGERRARARRWPAPCSPPASATGRTRSSATARLHAGIDLRAPTGHPDPRRRLPARWSPPAAGAATATPSIIDHGGALATLYGHQSRSPVRHGAAGRGRARSIGAAGSTGFSTGPHLHFEVRVDGAPVDPRGYL